MSETTGATPELGGGGSGRALATPPDEVAILGPPPTPTSTGRWQLEPVDATDEGQVELVAGWMATDHVARHWEQAWPVPVWREELRRQLADDHSRPHLALLDGTPVAYVEVYRVARDVLAESWAAEPHDLGVHLAIGDPARTGRGVGPDLLAHLAEGLLAVDPRCRRIVGDPEVGHAAARGAFEAAGFRTDREVTLPHKVAAVMVHGRGPTGPRSDAR